MANEKQLIYPAMIKILRACTAIAKDRKNEMQNYKFRGIDDILNELHSYFAEHGVFIMQEILETIREERVNKSGGLLIYSYLKIKYTFYAEDGSSVSAIGCGESMDSGDKSSNKAQSSALKYVLLQGLLIPTEEKKDVENDNPEPLPKKTEPSKPNAAEAAKNASLTPSKPIPTKGEFDNILKKVAEKDLMDNVKKYYELTDQQELVLKGAIEKMKKEVENTLNK